MNNYKPYSYLYKRDTEPAKLKSRFIAQIPAGRKIALRSGDPTIQGSDILIRYDIEEDVSITQSRKEEFENEFSWNGSTYNVVVTIGDGSGGSGGTSVIDTNDAEDY